MSNAGRHRSYLTRRRFLGTASLAAAALAGAAVVGCGDGKRRTASVPTASLTPPGDRAAVNTRGGVLRAYNLDALSYDSLDPHLTQMGPIADIHSLIYSRLYRYADERAGTIVPDLAAAMPEQPDDRTYVITLRQGVTFHDTPKFRAAHSRAPGRVLDAEDVKYSIERQMNASASRSPRFFRRSNWNVIDTIEARDARTIAITTKKPVAPFMAFLAGRHAFIIPREVPGRTDVIATDVDVIGSGPFILNAFETGQVVGVARNPSWFARDDGADSLGSGRPFLDGYEAYFSPEEDTFQRAAFQRHIVDSTGFVDPAALDTARKTNLGDIDLQQGDAGAIVAMRLLLDRGIFKDDRVRRALHLAIDRTALIELMYPTVDGHASAKLSGPIAPAMTGVALNSDDLARRPGYRTGVARDADIAAAKQLWQAAVGDAVTEIRVAFAGKPGVIPLRAAEALKRQLSDVLGSGVSVVTQTDPSGYAVVASSLMRNLEGATDGIVPATFMLEDGGVDLDDWLYPHFRSGASMNTYRLQDPQLDVLLDRSRSEFDTDARIQIGRDIQEYLLSNVNARIDICAPIERRLVWGFVRNATLPLWYGAAQDLADVWIDSAHPAWRPRPT